MSKLLDLQSSKTLDDILLFRARETPKHVALLDRGVEYTFGSLQAKALELAELLHARGVRTGDRVVLLGENSAAVCALLFAISKVRACAVILNGRLSEIEIAKIMEHSEPRIAVLHTEHSTETLLHAQRLAAESAATRLTPGVFIREFAKPAKNSEAQPSDVAVLIYTSGTTGQPKGIMLTHENLLFVARASSELRRLTAQDVVFGGLPLSHAYGLSSVLLASLMGGSCLHLESRPNTGRVLEVLRSGNISVFLGVPAMYAQLVALAEKERMAPKSWGALRYLSCGGAPLDPQLKSAVEKLFALPLHNGYGLSETAPTLSVSRDPALEPAQSVGVALPGVALKILDSQGAALPANAIGELWVKGPNVMRGYFRDPEQTRAVLTPDGWFNTQDLAYLDGAGLLYISGRSKELIIRSGFNVYPAEVEAALNSHPSIEQSAVIGRKHGFNEEIIAFVVWKQETAVEDVRRFLQERLAPYKIPTQIIALPALPSAPNGKIRKQELFAKIPPSQV